MRIHCHWGIRTKCDRLRLRIALRSRLVHAANWFRHKQAGLPPAEYLRVAYNFCCLNVLAAVYQLPHCVYVTKSKWASNLKACCLFLGKWELSVSLTPLPLSLSFFLFLVLPPLSHPPLSLSALSQQTNNNKCKNNNSWCYSGNNNSEGRQRSMGGEWRGERVVRKGHDSFEGFWRSCWACSQTDRRKNKLSSYLEFCLLFDLTHTHTHTHSHTHPVTHTLRQLPLKTQTS